MENAGETRDSYGADAEYSWLCTILRCTLRALPLVSSTNPLSSLALCHATNAPLPVDVTVEMRPMLKKGGHANVQFGIRRWYHGCSLNSRKCINSLLRGS